MFNVIPKSQTSSTVGSPVIGNSGGAAGLRFDVGSPSRMSLDKGKGKGEEDSGVGGGLEETERGRSRNNGDGEE